MQCKVVTWDRLNKVGHLPSGSILGLMAFSIYIIPMFVYNLLSVDFSIVVLASPPITVGLLAPLAKLARKRVIVDVQDLWPESLIQEGYLKKRSPAYPVLWLSEKIAYLFADRLSTVSRGLAERIQSNYVGHIVVLRSEADIGVFRPKEADPELRRILDVENKKVVLYVGSVGEAQQLENFVLAFGQLLSDLDDVVFLIVGDGERSRQVKALCRTLSITDSVRFIQPVRHDKVVDYIALADVCVVPLHESEQEAMPTKLFEYMACGKPVVAVSSKSIERLLQVSGAGFFIESPTDWTKISDSLRALVTDDALRREMGSKAREFCEHDFDFDGRLLELVCKDSRRYG